MVRGVACFALVCLLLGAANTSAARPGCVCTAIYDPVCGEDGQDYSSPCQADCAGVTVAAKGMCESSTELEQPDVSLGSTDDCYCTKLYNPVCGEDGVTYQNECTATCAGASVESDGECVTKSQNGNKVSAAVVQEDSPGTAAGDAAENTAATDITPPAAAAVDTAVKLPAPTATRTPPKATNDATTNGPKAGCVCAALYQPVCGADGTTYPNACEADCQGVSVAAAGPCASAVTASDVGDEAVELPTSEDPLPSSADASSAEGCVCAAVFEPVCGDDGQDYSNACEADCAGVPVARKGRCSSDSLPAGSSSSSDSCACPKIYMPVCTRKGATRSNQCMADCKGETVAYKGPCKPKNSTATAAAAAAVTDESSVKNQTSGTTSSRSTTATAPADAAGAAAAAVGGNATGSAAEATATPAGPAPKGNSAAGHSSMLASTLLAVLCFVAMLL